MPMNECVPEAGMRLHDKFNDTRVALTTNAPGWLTHVKAPPRRT